MPDIKCCTTMTLLFCNLVLIVLLYQIQWFYFHDSELRNYTILHYIFSWINCYTKMMSFLWCLGVQQWYFLNYWCNYYTATIISHVSHSSCVLFNAVAWHTIQIKPWKIVFVICSMSIINFPRACTYVYVLHVCVCVCLENQNTLNVWPVVVLNL